MRHVLAMSAAAVALFVVLALGYLHHVAPCRFLESALPGCRASSVVIVIDLRGHDADRGAFTEAHSL